MQNWKKGSVRMNTALCIRSKEIRFYKAHAHGEMWEIILQLTGKAQIAVSGEERTFSEGDVLVLPPGTRHEAHPGAVFTDIYVQARNMDFSDILFVHDYDGSVRQLLFLLERIMAQREANYAAIADALTEAVCQYVRKYAEMEFRYGFAVQFKNCLYEHLSDPDFSISAEIRRLGYNEDYFRRCFREETGQTPLAYLTALKMETAQKLLRQKMFQSVEAVARQCGYSDSFYFSKIFKKHAGLSPREYRRLYGDV